jgi:hypothetical protein
LTLADQNDDFGTSVSVRDGAILVGAPQRDLGVPNRVSQGAAYLYQQLTSGDWALAAELNARPDTVTFNLFGQSVALADKLAIVGAPKIGPYGAVYVYPSPPPIPEPTSCCHVAILALILLGRSERPRSSKNCTE